MRQHPLAASCRSRSRRSAAPRRRGCRRSPRGRRCSAGRAPRPSARASRSTRSASCARVAHDRALLDAERRVLRGRLADRRKADARRADSPRRTHGEARHRQAARLEQRVDRRACGGRRAVVQLDAAGERHLEQLEHGDHRRLERGDAVDPLAQVEGEVELAAAQLLDPLRRPDRPGCGRPRCPRAPSDFSIASTVPRISWSGFVANARRAVEQDGDLHATSRACAERALSDGRLSSGAVRSAACEQRALNELRRSRARRRAPPSAGTSCPSGFGKNARQRIHLDDVRHARRVEAHVDARPVAAAEHAVGAEDDVLDRGAERVGRSAPGTRRCRADSSGRVPDPLRFEAVDRQRARRAATPKFIPTIGSTRARRRRCRARRR